MPSRHACSGGAPAKEGAPVVAVVGVPNSGKSTLFNSLAGAKIQMGNWPGTTVEVSRGVRKTDAAGYDAIDFPNAYSLDAMSLDEELAREMFIEKPEEECLDLVAVVVNVTALGRGLHMAAELVGQSQRVVLALTKPDVAKVKGINMNPDALQLAMGMPVVAPDPRRKAGAARLADAVAAALDGRSSVSSPIRRADGDSIERLDDARSAVIDVAVAATTGGVGDRQTFSDRIGNVALHLVLGPIVSLAVMWAVFQIITTVAVPLQDGLETFVIGNFVDLVIHGLEAMGWDHPIVMGLFVNGAIGGVGMALTFALLMALIFLCLTVLEDSGYMARAAVVADRAMHVIGLPGKAFTPPTVGFGCNVSAISATRVLSNPRHRILAVLLVPFTSYSARLTVYVMLGAVFFPEHAGTVVFVMCVISILLIVLTGLALRKILWCTMSSEPLVINLLTYQLLTAQLALSVIWMRPKDSLQTASGIIVSTVTVVWLLMSIPVVSGHSFTDEGLAPQDSAYDIASATIVPVFNSAGFSTWSLTGPLVTGFVAKEAVISIRVQTYATEDVTDLDSSEQASNPFAENTRRDFNNASDGNGSAVVWVYMIFLLAYTSCAATLTVQRCEIGLKWTGLGLLAQPVVVWALVAIALQGLKLFLQSLVNSQELR